MTRCSLDVEVNNKTTNCDSNATWVIDFSSIHMLLPHPLRYDLSREDQVAVARLSRDIYVWRFTYQLGANTAAPEFILNRKMTLLSHLIYLFRRRIWFQVFLTPRKNIILERWLVRQPKLFFWPNPASAVNFLFLWIITHQVFYEAYPPDIKRIFLSVLRKMTKFKVKVQISRSNIHI